MFVEGAPESVSEQAVNNKMTASTDAMRVMKVEVTARLGLCSYVDAMAMTPAEMIDNDPYAAQLGMELRGDEPIEVAMTVGAKHLNFLGVTHGGAMFSLADCAFALAANRAGARAVAIDTHLVLSGGSAEGDVLTAVAEETTRGRTLATYRIVVRRNGERIVGLFTGTVHISS